MSLLLLVVILLLVFGGGGYWGYGRWGARSGLGIIGLVFVILLVCYPMGYRT